MSQAWPARLSPNASKTLAALEAQVQEMVRDVLDIASRQPWGWSQWDPTDVEGEDLRTASVGPLTVVYWINRPREHLYVLDIVWAG
ncbi:hypothetical protein [Streptomyces ipomoeae]|uniref:hypothetical protein n=1 Tax=Streptomyces ipomoeae TaxID=103232 RepID=UPI0029B154C9|nr:hypothetical protein [Streptomyces ipomoeae]MDX2692213.1 hypothetical protein [Streptomyces ipomoeae]MDX2843573.1 hypothetical protein [Streptomyces ipomoeae]